MTSNLRVRIVHQQKHELSIVSIPAVLPITKLRPNRTHPKPHTQHENQNTIEEIKAMRDWLLAFLSCLASISWSDTCSDWAVELAESVKISENCYDLLVCCQYCGLNSAHICNWLLFGLKSMEMMLTYGFENWNIAFNCYDVDVWNWCKGGSKLTVRENELLMAIYSYIDMNNSMCVTESIRKWNYPSLCSCHRIHRVALPSLSHW